MYFFPGAVAGFLGEGNHEAATKLLRELPDDDKRRLVYKIQELVKSPRETDLTVFVLDKDNRAQLINLIKNERNTMHLERPKKQNKALSKMNSMFSMNKGKKNRGSDYSELIQSDG